jgi:hypothetical protein
LQAFRYCGGDLRLSGIKAQYLFLCGELPCCGALLLSMLRRREFFTLLLLKAF